MDGESILGLTGLALYAGLFLLPFFQEDVAVVAAATASIMSIEPIVFIFAAILTGLTASDVWKYWLGYFARKHDWAHRFAEKKGVSVAGDLVRNELGKTLYVARFVPGTRVPTYVACGFFEIPYAKFCAIVVLTAFTYVAVTFALFHTVGAVAGEQTKYWLPAIAIVTVGSYILVRWLRHRGDRLGPMTPMSDDFDHPLEESVEEPASDPSKTASSQTASSQTASSQTADVDAAAGSELVRTENSTPSAQQTAGALDRLRRSTSQEEPSTRQQAREGVS
ncbi:MAG: VTT domain-containing protein [Pseudomonadota bacterium]